MPSVSLPFVVSLMLSILPVRMARQADRSSAD